MSSVDKTPIGAKFGRLTVAGPPEKIDGRHRVVCTCECGKSLMVRCLSLATGNTTSCGCLHKEGVSVLNLKHGLSKSPTYETYLNMVNRCTKPTNKKFADYGGRGISVCDDWLAGFDNFLRDMGIRPEGHTIDRIDPDGNYCPENCRWVTWKAQQNNKRNNRVLEFNGQTKTLQQWADQTGLSHTLIHYRLRRGWSIERSLSEPPVIGRNQFSK